MKKVLNCFMAFIVLTGSYASTPIKFKPPLPKAAEIMLPIAKGRSISLLQLSSISRAELELLAGKKMSFPQSLAFRGAQKKMKKGINSAGEISSKKMQKMFYADGRSGFNPGGFALGFFAGLIGVLIAYLIKDDHKKNRVKWAWLGLGIAVVLTALAYAVVYASLGR